MKNFGSANPPPVSLIHSVVLLIPFYKDGLYVTSHLSNSPYLVVEINNALFIPDQNKHYNIDQKEEGTLEDRGRDGGTNFVLRIKEQETRLNLHEHDDDDVIFISAVCM